MKEHIEYIQNHQNSEREVPSFLQEKNTESVRYLHNSLPSYQPTPLVNLKALAEDLGVRGIYVKDESKRFGLNAFKGLGGIYALSKVVMDQLGLDIRTEDFAVLQSEAYREKVQKMVFVTATDGNHGKGVAWAAHQLGCEAHVYMPKGSSEARAEAIRNVGAEEVLITDLVYDDAVRFAAKQAAENGWFLVQDTSWPGYEEIPAEIIRGYTTMAWEAVRQLKEDYGVEAPTHVFLQAGVGAMAGGVTGFLMDHYSEKQPILTIVEPKEVACIYESAKVNDGGPHTATGSGKTIMAGLNCGEPCTITWPILRDYASWYLSCPDYVAARGMRRLAAPMGNDSKVVSGESGAAAAGAAFLILEDDYYSELRRSMKLDKDSVILLFNTEGDTDPEAYRHIIYDGAYPVPEDQ